MWRGHSPLSSCPVELQLLQHLLTLGGSSFFVNLECERVELGDRVKELNGQIEESWFAQVHQLEIEIQRGNHIRRVG